MSGTFAPQFIKTDALFTGAKPGNVEEEIDVSGKRYVWLDDADKTFVKGWIVEEQQEGEIMLVQCDDGSQRTVEAESVAKVNPVKFDKAGDMAELTYLNEASVVHNLHTRYQSDLIYTYSGLFLVTVNPYCPIPIYTRDYINMYRGRSREDTKPHIFAVADEAFRKLVTANENQSILVTGESGAGKTENTKKVIQYLAAVAASDGMGSRSGRSQHSNLSQQILRANPILESFGNAQTVRNNNSSRFGKFIRIQFTPNGQIAGALIDWYLLEKSRVVKLNTNERNYHIFYQLLRGADASLKRDLLIGEQDVEDFEYTAKGNDVIAGVSDQEEWHSLMEAFNVMDFTPADQLAVLRSVAAILHLGNVHVSRESLHSDQASLDEDGKLHLHKACRLLGVQLEPFMNALLHPRVKAGREWVRKVQTPEQVRLAIDALAKGIYERAFGDLVERINSRINRSDTIADDTNFVGVLDIAGFEIFEDNSFEQLCINYTNEKLQQFFNHHMFVLEQEEYAREQIEWQFIDFGKDLQPTIDLIELSNPIGIFSCLDEDSVMPKATDKTFTEKLHGLWDSKSQKYRRSKLSQGFMLTHYAAAVEYSTEGWLEKNKDPLNDNATKLLAASSESHVAQLFSDCADLEDEASAQRSRIKKGLFRTVAQRHKEQLSGLMTQLHSTHPHFVRCILPNHKKRPKTWDASLVLDQLRCNGVLEGIRIARSGFPNRIPFSEFRSRYEVLCTRMPRVPLDGQTAAKIILDQLQLEPSWYRIGLTKVFFRAGVLAELEEQREALIREIVCKFQSLSRGFVRRRAVNKTLYRAEAARIIHHNFQVYLELQANPWWRLFVRMRPLLGTTRQSNELKKRDEAIQKLHIQMQEDDKGRQKLEDDRKRAEQQTRQVQQVLENERALALDKEEIFKRLQEREVELNEKLAGALEDSEALEEQMEDMLRAKQASEDRASNLQRDLDQACALVETSEASKHALNTRIGDLENELVAAQESGTRVSENEQRLEQEVKVLESQLGLKDRKLHDLEQRVSQAEHDQVAAEDKADHATRVENRAQQDLKALHSRVDVKDCKIKDLENKVARADQDAAAKLAQRSRELDQQTGQKEEQLNQEIKMLNSQLGLKDRKIHDLEGKVLKSDQDLNAKVTDMTKEVQAAKRQARQMTEDHHMMSEAKSAVEFELSDLRAELDDLRKEREQEESTRLQLLEDIRLEREQDESSRAQMMQEFSELQMQLDSETANLDEVQAGLELYKARAEEYFNKLEQAEVAVLRATKAEQFAKSQCREAEETSSRIVSERKQTNALLEDLQHQIRNHEERFEDLSADLNGAQQAKKRLQQELDDYRSQRAADLEERETSAEQTRSKYQSELSALTSELAFEREAANAMRMENSQIREELEDMRSKWDDEMLNSSTWWKEKQRLETALESISRSRDDAVEAHDEAQERINVLMAQLRSLRSQADNAAAENDSLAFEKQTLEKRLQDALGRLDNLARSESPSMREAAAIDRDLLQLKADLGQQGDISAAAVGKMRRAEALTQESQKEVAAEREKNMQLHREKATLDKSVKDLQLRLVDLETKGYSSASQDVRFLHRRIQELEQHVEEVESSRTKENRSTRNNDRQLRDLQSQLDRKESANAQLQVDADSSRNRIDRLLKTVDELQASDSDHSLAAKRAERELQSEKERRLKIEKELEALKDLRGDRENLGASLSPAGADRKWGNGRPLSEVSGNGGWGGSIRSNRSSYHSRAGSVESVPVMRPLGVSLNSIPGSPEVPRRKSSLSKGPKAESQKDFL